MASSLHPPTNPLLLSLFFLSRERYFSVAAENCLPLIERLFVARKWLRAAAAAAAASTLPADAVVAARNDVTRC